MKSLTLHYPNFTQKIELKTSFQVNRIAKSLIQGLTSSLLEFENGKCNKVSIKLLGVRAVISNVWEVGNPYVLKVVFEDGSEFNVPIWGEKRARNYYYAIQELLNKKADGKFFKILQTNKKDFSLISFYEGIRFVKLLDPEVEDLHERKEISHGSSEPQLGPQHSI
jgi:hypothetical protein